MKQPLDKTREYVYSTASVPNGYVRKIYLTASLPNGCKNLPNLTSDTGLAYARVVYASSDTGLAYTAVGYGRSISLLAYPAAMYVHFWCSQIACTQGSEPNVLNGCAPQIITRVKWLAFCQPQSRILGQQWVLKSINLVLSPATQSEVRSQ